MKALAVVAVAAVVIIIATFSFSPPDLTASDQEQAVAQAEKAINDRWDAYEAKATEMDLDTWLSYWTSDARVLEPGMNMSGSEIPAFGAEFFGSGGQVFFLDLESHEVFVHGEVAYQIGQYDEAFQMPGEARMEVQNYFFARWEKEDGIWKIDRLVAGPREAPAEG